MRRQERYIKTTINPILKDKIKKKLIKKRTIQVSRANSLNP